MKASDYEREKARVMNGVDINSEKAEMEENKRSVGSCVNDFTVVKELGRGSYGVVYRVLSNISKKEYVMKKINIKHMDQKHQKEAIKEANILRRVKHENIIRYYTSFVEHECLYIIMEYADGGDLQQLLRARREKKKQFTEQEIWDFGHDLIKAVDYLHKNNIIHRDIKTLNIFLTKEGKVKLGDLGVSKIISSQAALNGTRVGTPLYLAPELVKQQPYDIKVDIWAIGIVLYHISALEPPFQGENLIALGFNIVNKFPKPLPSIYSPKLVQFINKLLEKNPSNRPKTSELLDQFIVSKKSERPSTSSGVSSSQQQNTQQIKQHARPMTAVISDRMEVFDRGSFNLLNKIIEEDSELTVVPQMKKTEIIEKRQSIKRPNTGVPRTTKEKEEDENKINFNNNGNMFKNKDGEEDPIFSEHQSQKQQQFSDNTPTIVTNSNNTNSNKNLQNRGARSEHKNTDSVNENNNNQNVNVNNHYYNNGMKQSANNGNYSANSNSQNVSNSNVSAGDGKEKSSPLATKAPIQQPQKEQSTVSRNLSKTKELMTYNSKKIALITDYSTLFNDKLPQSSVSASSSKIESQHVPASNLEAQQQNENKQSSFPLRIVGQAFSVSQTPSKNIEISFKSNGQLKDEGQPQQQAHQQRHLVKVQKEDLWNPAQENGLSKPIEKDKTLDEEDIKNNKKSAMKEEKHRNSKDSQGQNPLVAYFNVSKASQENLANNFKIRPFSAQVKPRDHQQQLQLKEQKKRQNKVDNYSNNNNNGNCIETASGGTGSAAQSSSQTVSATTAQSDAMKLEQMIKEFRQEAQKIREAPLNIYSSHHQHPNPYKQQTKESIQVMQSEKSSENTDKILKEQEEKINKNFKENSNTPNAIIKPSDAAAARPKSAHPLLGNKKPSSAVLNQLNDKEVLKAKGPQTSKLPSGITLISSSSSRKQLVDEFIKNNIGRMNNNFIVEPSPTAAAKKKKGESVSKGSDILDKNQFFYRIDNVSRDFIESDGSGDNKNTKDDKAALNKGSRLKSAVSSIFEKEQSKSNNTNPNHNSSTSNQEEASKIKQQQPPGKVLLLNNTRPQTSSGIRKKYTLKDLTGDGTTTGTAGGTATATGLTNNRGNDLLLTSQ